MKRAIVLGTRSSPLALRQTATFARRLERIGVEVRILTIDGSGDSDLTTPLSELRSPAPFADTLGEALRDGRIDAAVHSMKDLGSERRPGLHIAAIPERENPAEVLVSRQGLALQDLPPGGRVGSSSIRRAAQILRCRPDLDPRPIRGSVGDRIGQMSAGRFDAVMLALAGLRRLGRESEVTQYLPQADFLPAPAQGCLAVECRSGDTLVSRLLRSQDDPVARWEGETEVRVAAALEKIGGALAVRATGGAPASAEARWLEPNGEVIAEGKVEGPADRALAVALIEQLLIQREISTGRSVPA